jgi:hypothetical protein
MPLDTRQAAREIVDAVRNVDPDRDPRDVLSGWERDSAFGAKSVQLRIPLRDPVEVRNHLKLLAKAVDDLRFKLDRTRGDQLDLKMVEGQFKALNHHINAYRHPRR